MLLNNNILNIKMSLCLFCTVTDYHMNINNARWSKNEFLIFILFLITIVHFKIYIDLHNKKKK